MSESGAGIVLSCDGISKIFPVQDRGLAWQLLFGDPLRGKHVTALAKLSLGVPKGKFVGVMGRNGAGKSTLLRILGRTYTPTTGTVKSEGSLSGLFELGGIGNPQLTGRDYARRILALQGVQRRAIPGLVEEILEFSELGADFERQVYTYSTGMAARLYFSTATAIPHDLYLIDEALSVGDEHFQNKCWQRMRQRLLQGASGVLVTHDWSAVLKLCEVAHIMDKGAIVFSGPAETTVREYLGLPQETFAPGAKFLTLPATCRGTAGNDFLLDFEVAVEGTQPVFFNYSIELMRLGFGWEIVLLGRPFPVASQPGRYRVSMKIPRLPMTPGNYSLNLFLSGPMKDGRASCGYDARGWTYGNNLMLEVAGEPRANLAKLPMVWAMGDSHA